MRAGRAEDREGQYDNIEDVEVAPTTLNSDAQFRPIQR